MSGFTDSDAERLRREHRRSTIGESAHCCLCAEPFPCSTLRLLADWERRGRVIADMALSSSPIPNEAEKGNRAHPRRAL